MNWKQRVQETLHDITGDAARDADIVEELAEYLAQRYVDLRATGLSEDDAVARTLDELRDSRGVARALRKADRPRRAHPVPPPTSGAPSMRSDFWRDVRYAVRLLRKTPGYTAAAILTLTLGIGATTAIVSVVDAVLLRRVPFANADRLAMVWETDRNSGTTREPSSLPDFLDFRERSRQFTSLAAFTPGDVTMSPRDAEPVRLAALGVTENFLPMLGIAPARGRNFTADEDRPGGPRVVLISDRLWERAFQRAPDVIGRVMRLNDTENLIVGVMPPDADFGILQILGDAAYVRGFADKDPRARVDIWAPLRGDVHDMPRDTHPIIVVGRLGPGASVQTAQQEMGTITADLERAFPVNAARGAHVESLNQVIFGRVRPALWALAAAVAAVLLIACVNVANLLLARGTTRQREIAVRTALGASGRRLARQFTVENLVLTLAASAGGVVVAAVALRALVAMAPADIPRLASASIDARVLGIAIVIAVITGLVFGLVPVLQMRRLDVQGALRTEESRTGSAGRKAGATRSALVVAEIAMAAVLVMAAGLLVRSVWRLQHVDAGFDARGVLKAEFQLPPSRYPADMRAWPNFAAMHRFNGELLRRLTRMPGVAAAAIAANHPLDAGFTNSFVVVGREAEAKGWPEISVRRVSPEYFATVRLGLEAGRLLASGDATDAAPVAVINHAAAKRFFGKGNALTRQLRFWGTTRTIVGVVADERFHGLTAESPPAVYLPLAQAPSVDGGEVVLVRATAAAGALAGPVRRVITEIDPALAVFGVEPLSTTVSESIGQRRFVTLLLALFGTLALVLAAVGIHGVLSYAVASRRHEIAIRVALGAPPARVTRMVVLQGLRLTAVGLLLGLAGGVAVQGLLRGLLFGVAPSDPVTLAVALPALAGVGMLAAWLPARRAVRVEALAALRDE